MGKLNLTYNDYDDEQSTMGVYAPDLTAGNFAAQETLRNAFIAAVEGVTIGALRKTSVIAVDTPSGSGPAANSGAQRELKWLVRGVSNTGFPVSFEIPCADTSLLEVNGPRMDPGGAEWAALKADGEAYLRSNRLTETVTLIEAVLVGRNI